MTEENIVQYELDPDKQKGLSKETIGRFESMTDDEVEAAIAQDSDIAPLSVITCDEYTFDPNELNFYKDWIEHLKLELQRMKYTVTETDPLKIAIQYFNAKTRRIESKPREAHLAQELKENPLYLGHYRFAIDEIVRVVRAGEDLTPFLSRRLKCVDFNDYLLNVWGVYHFHLGTSLESDGFVKRKGELLYGMVFDDAILFIDIYQHNQWSHRSVIDVLARNWPDVMSAFEVQRSGSEDYTDEVRYKQWKGHADTFVRSSSGTWYRTMNGGLTTAGSGAELTRMHDICAHMLNEWQEAMIARIDVFAEESRKSWSTTFR